MMRNKTSDIFNRGHFIWFNVQQGDGYFVFLYLFTFLYKICTNSSWCRNKMSYQSCYCVSCPMFMSGFALSVSVKWSHGQIHWSSWHWRSGGGVWSHWHPGVWLPVVGDAGRGQWSRDNSDNICILHYYHQVHATLVILAQKGLMSTDELRRAMEALPGHKEMTYYHR